MKDRSALFVAGFVALFCAPAVHAGELFGTQIGGDDILILIDRTTAEWTLVGPTKSSGAMNGLAYDNINGILYGINPAPDQLFTIDVETGLATGIGSPGDLGFPNANGLAFDPDRQILYATDSNTNSLFLIDQTSGIGSFIATITGGFAEIEGLAFDPETDTLYGITDLQNRIVQIDVSTGEAVGLPQSLPNDQWRGLTFDPEGRELYATSVTESFLYRVDPVRGSAELIGELKDASSVQGLAFMQGLSVAFDVKPGSCPNPLNRKSHGMMPAAILGTDDFDAAQIDVSSVMLWRADGIGGSVAPNEGPPGPHSVLEDVGTPFDGESCDCHELEADRVVDLLMHFQTQDVVEALELDDLPPGTFVELTVTGVLVDKTPFTANDCIYLVPAGDMDGDGAVGATDLIMLISSWGSCGECIDCPLDLDGDCAVGAGDLLILLANWG